MIFVVKTQTNHAYDNLKVKYVNIILYCDFKDQGKK